MIVLDASALVDVLIDQPTKEVVLSHLDQPVAAPAHQPAEVLSALARLVRARSIGMSAARSAMEEAAALDQALVLPRPVHLRRALELQDRVRLLDGLYVALAEELDCPLLTTDRRLAAAIPPCDVLLVTTGQ